MTRVLLLGGHARFTATVLRRMLAAGVDVRGVVLPAPGGATDSREPPPGRIPVAREESVVGLARSHGVPVAAVPGVTGAAARSRIARFAPEVAVSACFPFVIPDALVALPRLGAVNLHPSLLPAFRGPSPVFWQLRAGLTESGITLHHMTEEVDAGDIVSQRRLGLSSGETASGITGRLAAAGAELVLEALAAPGRLAARRRRQDPARVSYMGWPGPADFAVPTTWSAERAYRFMAGVAEWRVPFTVCAGEERIPVARALGVAPLRDLDAPHRTVGKESWIRFSPGVLRVPAVSPGAATPPGSRRG